MQILKTMYPNYKVVLDLRKGKKSGLYPVKVRVTLNRVQKYFSIGLDLSISDFDRVQNGSVRKELKVFKSKITHWENKTKDIIHQVDPFTFDEFKSKFYEKNNVKVADVYALFDLKIGRLNEQGKVSTGRTYRDAKNSLKESISKHSIRPDSTLITDGGPENHGEVSGFVAGNPNISQLIAQKDII